MHRLLVATALGMLLVSRLAAAEVSERGDAFMRGPMQQTVYATERHMGFSVRSTLIGWLGGLTVVDERDLRASQRDRWWGETVPLVGSGAAGRPSR